MVAEIGYNATMGHHLTTNQVDLNQLDPKIFESYVKKLGFDSAYALMNAQITSASAQAAGVPYPYPSFRGTVGQALRPFRSTGASTPRATAATAAATRPTTR